MTTFITVLQVLACLILIISVLLQQPKGGGTVFGGTSQSVFGSTGGTTFMFRLSMWSAVFIMVTSLFLAWYKNNEGKNTVVDMSVPAAATLPAAPTTETNGAASAPAEAANAQAPVEAAKPTEAPKK